MKEDIRPLLDLFYRGELTIDEEHRLICMLLSNDCPEDLRAERHAVISLARPEAIKMPENMGHRLEKTIMPRKANRYQWLAVAACLVIIMGVGLWAWLPKTAQRTEPEPQPIADVVKPPLLQPEQKKVEEPDTPLSQSTRTAKRLRIVKRSSGMETQEHPIPITRQAEIPEVDVAAEISDILANIDQLEQQILSSNPQTQN